MQACLCLCPCLHLRLRLRLRVHERPQHVRAPDHAGQEATRTIHAVVVAVVVVVHSVAVRTTPPLFLMEA